MSSPATPPPANTFGFTAWRGLTDVMSASHAHNDIEINFSAAPLTYDSGGRSAVLPGGVPSAFWGATPHRLIDVDALEPLAYVTVPLARFMTWGLPSSVTDRLLRGGILQGPEGLGDVDDLGAAFARWGADLGGSSRSPLRERAAELEISGLLVRMSEGGFSTPRSGSAPSSRDLRRAAEMAGYLATHLGDDVRVSDVARVVHLHPHRAAAVFRDVFGVGVKAYLGQHRVAEAQRLLLTTDLGSAEVGVRAGFQSPSSYHAAFGEVTGMSPNRWRREHRG
ncbi:helix-turn-helix domain-containing protein [Planococcus sp. APC 4015]|nr:helix-turn-helix domain-containing protein [Planococcus sp. APC 4015]